MSIAEESVELVSHQLRNLLLQLFVGLNTARVEHPLVQRMLESIAG